MTHTLDELMIMRQREVESRFAGCLLVNPVQTVQDCGWLRPEVILDERIRSFWQLGKSAVIPGMFSQGAAEEITRISMETGVLNEILPYAELQSSAVPLAYAQEIARRAWLTSQTDLTQKLVGALRLSDDETARKIIREMAGQEIREAITAPTAYDVATLFQQVVESGVRSVPFYLGSMDRATGGMERQTLTIIAARPSVGKTALAWQIAQSCAYSNKRVLFFSIEMAAVNLWGRAACPKINTTWRDVRAGKLSAEQKARLAEESYALSLQFEDRLKIIDGTNQTTETVWRTVADHRPDLVIVDHLRLLKDTAQSEVKRLGEISQRMKDIAKNFNCAVLLLAQLNRQSELRAAENKRPLLADLRDSGEIEENGDLILMLHRDEPQTEKKPDKSITECWVRKFRDGPRDVLIKLLFDPKAEWFEELPK